VTVILILKKAIDHKEVRKCPFIWVLLYDYVDSKIGKKSRAYSLNFLKSISGCGFLDNALKIFYSSLFSK